jgi:predicted amidohydrolase YtcJ
MASTTIHGPADHRCPGCLPPVGLSVLADVRPARAVRPLLDRARPQPTSPAGTATGVADLIVVGSVVTMDPARPAAEALAIRDGRIVAVGTEDEVRAHAGPDTEVLALGDDVVLPGFVEPHMHLWTTALFDAFLDCSPLTHDSHLDVFALLAEAGSTTPAGGWVRGQLWDPSLFPDAPPLDRDLLDVLVPDHPAFVMNASMHFAYLNSRALEAVGLTDDTPDPEGGFYGRTDGRLDGVLGEFGAIAPAVGHLPRLSHDEFLETLVRIGRVAAAAGVTAIHEAATGTLFGATELDLLRGLAAADRLPVRVGVAILDAARQALDGCAPGDGDDLVRLVSWKLIADGSNQGRSGRLREPYLGSDERGRANYADDDLRERMARAAAEGWQLMVHANGDAALDQVLDAYEAIGPGPERRHRIEHSSLASDEHFARMAALGVSPSFLMNHVYYWGHAFRDDVLGPDRAATLDAAASARRHDLRISFHSDYRVSPISPLRSVQTAITRELRAGGTLNPDEAITVDEALRAVTIDAAWQTHRDDAIGSIEVGKLADLVVLSANPRKVDPSAIADIEVRATYLAGRPVEA